MNLVHVIDYGVGNIFNVVNALKFLNYTVELYTEGDQFEEPDCVILPGVGAFGDCMQALRERKFIEPLTNYVKNGGKLIGICVGMHLLAEKGEEFGLHEGLGFVSGRVKHILTEIKNSQLKIPHVAWQTLKHDESLSGSCNLVSEKFFNKEYYFVHSYKFCCDSAANEVAFVQYNSERICAIIREKNVVGVQFHPEKSGPVGLAFLQELINTNFSISGSTQTQKLSV